MYKKSHSKWKKWYCVNEYITRLTKLTQPARVDENWVFLSNNPITKIAPSQHKTKCNWLTFHKIKRPNYKQLTLKFIGNDPALFFEFIVNFLRLSTELGATTTFWKTCQVVVPEHHKKVLFQNRRRGKYPSRLSPNIVSKVVAVIIDRA